MNPILFLLWHAAQVLVFLDALLYGGVVLIVCGILAAIAFLLRRKKTKCS